MFETFKKQYVCDRCGGHFGLTCLRRHFEKCAQTRRYSGAVWTSGAQLVFDDEGRAWCPQCFPDPESFRRGRRTVRRRNPAELTPPPGAFVSYGCE
jgi:hypothetical protein